MTRVNLVPPKELHDKHLVAEYRELPRIASLASRKRWNFVIPSSYRLGVGHMDFFVDKGAWCSIRHASLVTEMKRRGFEVNYPFYPIHLHPLHWRKYWEPDADAIKLNRTRINERLKVMKL